MMGLWCGVVSRVGGGESPSRARLVCGETNCAGVRLRVGCHVGQGGLRGEDASGHGGNLAARVADSAKGGEILATGDVRSAIGTPPPTVAFGRARRRTFKGMEGSVLVCPVRRSS